MDHLPILLDSNITGDVVECDKEPSHHKVLPGRDLHTPHSCRLQRLGNLGPCDILGLQLLYVKGVMSKSMSFHNATVICEGN